MSLFRIAWRSIQQRGLASALTMLSMALGVMLVVAVLLIMGIVSQSFSSNSSLGYNMIIAAKGGRLQVVLNSVYYLSAPVENIPYTFYQEFLPANERPDGETGEFSDLTKFAIPLCLGDYFQEYRVIGTTEQMFDDYVYDAGNDRKYEFSSGRNFKTFTPEHGYFEAILGAEVARKTGVKVGDTFSPTHGPDGDAHDSFFVVGILKSSGTPNDRAAFVNLEGFLMLDGHAKPVKDKMTYRVTDESEAEVVAGKRDVLAEVKPGTYTLEAKMDDTAASEALPFRELAPHEKFDAAEIARVCKLPPERQALTPLPTEQREVTAILLRTVNGLVTPGLRNTINEGKEAQAVLPMSEILQLFRTIVGPIKNVLLGITTMVCIVSGISILVSIYNSMNDRRQEIAVMRALGAGRRIILVVVLLESVMLALIGGVIGWIAGHLLIGGLLSPAILDRTGVSIGVFDLAPGVKPLEFVFNSPIYNPEISNELLIVPGLIVLAILVGLWPALSAHRTDVAKAL